MKINSLDVLLFFKSLDPEIDSKNPDISGLPKMMEDCNFYPQHSSYVNDLFTTKITNIFNYIK